MEKNDKKAGGGLHSPSAHLVNKWVAAPAAAAAAIVNCFLFQFSFTTMCLSVTVHNTVSHLHTSKC